jgi:branched-chain amino acid transport system substrate-binding protein
LALLPAPAFTLKVAPKFLLTLAVTALSSAALAQDFGVTDKEIRIGVTTNLNGPSNTRSKEMIQVAQVVFDNVNAAGGINGRKLKVFQYDDSFDPKLSIQNAKKLINEDKVFAIFFPYGTPTIKAFLPAAEAAHVPVLFPMTGAQFLRVPTNPYVFNSRVSYFDEAKEMVKFATQKLGEKTFMVLYQNNAFGQDGKNGVQKAADESGIKFTSAPYDRESSDIEKCVKEVVAAKPKVVLVFGNAEPAISLLEKLKAAGTTPIFIGNYAHGTSAFYNAADAYGAPVYMTQGMPLASQTQFSIIQDFKKAMVKAHLTPDFGSIHGYLDASILVEALKRAGPKLTHESFRQALDTMNDVDFGGLKVSFSPQNHQGLHRIFMTQVKNKDLVLAE